MERALKALRTGPGQTFIVGIVVLVVVPLVSLLFLVSILGAPFAITLIAVNVFAFYTAKIFSLLWIGKLIFKQRFERHRRLYYTLGLLIYVALSTIPNFGDLLSFVFMLFGLGAIVRGRMIEFSAK